MKEGAWTGAPVMQVRDRDVVQTLYNTTHATSAPATGYRKRERKRFAAACSGHH